MQLTNEEALGLVRQGVEALQAGRPDEARRHLERVTQTGRANVQIWLLLASACKGAGDAAGEEDALNRLLALEPNLLRAHIMKADCRARAGDEQGALGFYESALMLARTEQLTGEIAAEVRRVEATVAAARDRIDGQREAALAARGVPAEGRSARFAESIEILAGRKQIFTQAPTGYYFPGLANIQYFDTADFGWVPAVEAATTDILDELNGLLANRLDGFRPYLHGDPNKARVDRNTLLDSPDWSALFLCENGKVSEEFVARCPRTWAALQAAPMPWIANHPTAMFSLLRPGARIQPHSGMTNTRLICHLPLIVPPDCHFRVGNDVRQWQVGKLMIFDDTIEHEAWNDSREDRVVLIFDIWRPELSEQERREVAALMQGPTLD